MYFNSRFFTALLIVPLFCASMILPITQTRVSQINQFIDDLKSNKIAADQIEKHVAALTQGLSKRDMDSSQVDELNNAVAQAMKKAEVPSKGTETSQEVPMPDAPLDGVQNLYKDIEKFAAQINNWHQDANFKISPEIEKEAENTYMKLQESLLKQKSSPAYDKNYQAIFNTIGTQFVEIRERSMQSQQPVQSSKARSVAGGDKQPQPQVQESKSSIPAAQPQGKTQKPEIEAPKSQIEVPVSKQQVKDPLSKINKPVQKGLSNETSFVQKFNKLQSRSDKFAKKRKFPTQNNLIKNLAIDDTTKKVIVDQMETTWPIMHGNVQKLIQNFLLYKRQFGSEVEKNIYKSMIKKDIRAAMGVEDFIDRLLKKRPLMFMTSNDTYLLRDGKTSGMGGFETIGTNEEKAPLVMKDYLTYDEMQIAALIGVSVPTYFINDGSRTNNGVKGRADTFEEKGILVGLVGARFEKPGLMEWAHIMITPTQNTSENGYGVNATSVNKLLDIWSSFYGTKFPTFQEAQQDTSGRYHKIQNGAYFDTYVYKKRMAMVVEPFLRNANERGKELGKQVYAHIVGLGLGVWQVSPLQGKLLVDVYADIMEKNTFHHIADLDFSWFNVTSCGGVGNGENFVQGSNNIRIHFSKRNPSAKLSGGDENKLLVAQYAWDGNSYPGNEYWKGMLNVSGDPAAASSSTIPELQNPEINLHVSGEYMKMYQ